MQKICIFILLVFLITGCQPTEAQVRQAIEQTQTAGAVFTPSATSTATNTATIKPSSTPTETRTPKPTLTFTPTLTLTPTPDVRILNVDPIKFLLKSEELPEEGKYYIPGPDWMSVNTNEEVISLRGVEEGRDYVISTGRVTAWWVEFLRGTRAAQSPEDVYILVAKYRTAEGAQLSLTKYNDAETNKKNGWKYKTVDKGLGDKYNATLRETLTSGGDKQINLIFTYTYRNYLVEIMLSDFEKYVSYDFALELGKKVLNKLQAAPLEYPPTATPTP